MHKIFIAGLSLAILLFSGCEEEDDGASLYEQELRFFDLYMSSTYNGLSQETESGLHYIEVREGQGQAPVDGDWVMVDFVGYTIPQELVVESYIQNVVQDNDLADGTVEPLYGPVKMLVGAQVEGINEGLSLMKDGGQAIMCFTSDLGYGAAGASLMKNVSKYQSLKYEMELLQVIGSDIEQWEADRFSGYMDTITGAQAIYDSITGTTMYYIIDVPYPDSAKVVQDTVIAVGYKGYLMDGRVFDESEEDDPFILEYNANAGVIDGWLLGLEYFREGEEGRLFIPYQLAYGENGDTKNGIVTIPPYEALVFDIVIRDLSPHAEPEEEE